MAYLNEHIKEYRLKRDDIMLEVADAAGESTKIPGFNRLFRSLTRTSMSLGWSGTCKGEVPQC